MIRSAIRQYTHWLHTRWPAGTVEKLPIVQPDGSTNVPGLFVVGDVAGIPLLKFSSDTGARAVCTIIDQPAFARRDTANAEALDVVIIGAGVSGVSAALEARKRDLRFEIIEAAEPFSTIVNFPKAKPIYTYPTDMMPAGDLQFGDRSAVKEGLLDELRDYLAEAGIHPREARATHVERRGSLLHVKLADGQTVLAHRVIVAIGRSGNYRQLDIPGEDRGKVSNRLHDPADFADRDVLVVGGGDSALEAAIALVDSDARVTLSYRKAEFTRPKPENAERIAELASSGRISMMMASQPTAIGNDSATIRDHDGHEHTLPNDAVFTMIGREAPLDFFRRSGVKVAGDWRTSTWVGLIAFFVLITWVYLWKSHKIPAFGIDPGALWTWIADHTGSYFATPGTFGHTLAISASGRGFYYTLAYSLIVLIFGIRRIRRRRTPYVTWQTTTLMLIQVLPLFVLPEVLLPWLGHNGVFDSGLGKWLADAFVPLSADAAHGREYWRAYGFVLAWPLMVYNFFTTQPLWGWLIVGSLQTFVIIPLMVRRWGKGAYCGWVCSCGALAETLGDQHRHKMPHGPKWNRLNMIGQVILAVAVLLMLVRIIGWLTSSAAIDRAFGIGLGTYSVVVDLVLAGIVGYGLYFHFSGRVWCRFACPLAALMHIYARFSRFRIFAEKSKCISCNVCTSVCHQGIDVMSFANKGQPMADPECVRCSACVQSCPTGVLSFGRVAGDGQPAAVDRLAASPVRMAELRVHGRPL